MVVLGLSLRDHVALQELDADTDAAQKSGKPVQVHGEAQGMKAGVLNSCQNIDSWSKLFTF